MITLAQIAATKPDFLWQFTCAIGGLLGIAVLVKQLIFKPQPLQVQEVTSAVAEIKKDLEKHKDEIWKRVNENAVAARRETQDLRVEINDQLKTITADVKQLLRRAP